MQYDLKITGGTIIDGTGSKPYTANIAVKDGKIVEIGECSGDASKNIDANGAIVTPGFVDLHTHYDGQISWDEELMPSVNHGVTTIVTGNCGVGFAPCRAKDHEKLIRLMEGVEDIPGSALSEGITWDWESFPEYMQAIDKIPHTLDFAMMVPHDPLRVFVMGERAIAEEMATKDDIEKMKKLTREAMQAGAIGFSTGRSDFHKSADGDWTPASEAHPDELAGIATALNGLSHGVLHAVNDFNQERDGDQFDAEFDILEKFFRAAPGHKSSMTWMQRDLVPDHWQRIAKRTETLQKDGVELFLQAAPRAIGVFLGLQSTFHPLMAFPSYIAMADLPLAERVKKLRDPEMKKKMLAETPVQMAGPGSSIPPMADLLIAGMEFVAEKLFQLDPNGDGEVDYEQTQENSIAQKARDAGVSVWDKIYDETLKDNGKALIYFPAYNYTDMNYDAVYTMMNNPYFLPGLTDGGAHVGYICDASFPTYLLTHWTKKREDGGRNGKTISLPRAIQMMTADGADYLGFADRGRLKVGLKADINVIDYDNLSLKVPFMVNDLPAGGQRLLQPVTGYKATFVSGEQVIDNDKVTTARPGRLVRGGH
ncbi:MAG: amidohydrolase family protein [Robiginitomaculum sp.]|nr:amidohydrolase family protein [Robiginitomaculum sp.]